MPSMGVFGALTLLRSRADDGFNASHSIRPAEPGAPDPPPSMPGEEDGHGP